jgi:hypothetical protein
LCGGSLLRSSEHALSADKLCGKRGQFGILGENRTGLMNNERADGERAKMLEQSIGLKFDPSSEIFDERSKIG